MEEPPGFAVGTGMRRLSDVEQEKARAEHRELQRQIEPIIDENERVRRKAYAESHGKPIGCQ